MRRWSRRYANETRQSSVFIYEELEHVKMELAKYKLAEKTESSHEQWLFKSFQEEEAKSGHLSREVDALKEKIHEYMATEDLICHLRRSFGSAKENSVNKRTGTEI